MDMSDSNLLIASQITYVFDQNSFSKILQIGLSSISALILSNGNYLVGEPFGFCIFNNLGQSIWR